MASTEKSYVQEMAKAVGYFATWLPTVPLELGDYGVLTGKYRFVRIGNIRDIGVNFGVRQGNASSSIQYESSNAVDMRMAVSADASLPSAPITTKVEFSFSRENAVVFKANDVAVQSIEDQAALGKDVISNVDKGILDKKHRIITELVRAGSVTIIIASDKTSNLQLTAQGDVSSKLDIANAQLGFTATRKAAMAYSEVALQGLTPLFRTSGIKPTGLLRLKEDFQPFSAHKGADALDFITNAQIAEHPEAYYFGLDGLGYLMLDE